MTIRKYSYSGNKLLVDYMDEIEVLQKERW
jgi:hypothetical protein